MFQNRSTEGLAVDFARQRDRIRIILLGSSKTKSLECFAVGQIARKRFLAHSLACWKPTYVKQAEFQLPNFASPVHQKHRLRGAGAVLYNDDMDVAVLRVHHGEPPEILSDDPQRHPAALAEVVEDPAAPDHFIRFIKACMRQGTTNSPFRIGGQCRTQVIGKSYGTAPVVL